MPNPAPSAPRSAAPPQNFPPLALEARPRVSTEQAAHYLSRRPQTLRHWASADNGPVRPIRINGRLSWAMADIRNVLEVSV